MATLLLIDDDTDVREFYHTILTKAEHQVTTLPNHENLFSIIEAEKPDLILLDLNLPTVNGLDILKEIRAKKVEVPVAILSAHISAQSEQRAFESGAVEVLSKDMKNEEFLFKINKIISTPPEAFSQPMENNQQTILTVDDDPGIRDLITFFFKEKGFEVLSASNGEEAIQAVKDHHPDMILLDVNMPGMDGLLTLKKIREIDADVGIVMATGVQDEKIAQKAAQLGAYHYVRKPFDLKYLEFVVLTRLLIAA